MHISAMYVETVTWDTVIRKESEVSKGEDIHFAVQVVRRVSGEARSYHLDAARC